MAEESPTPKSPKRRVPKITRIRYVSLAGPTFDEVLEALLKTPPMPNEHKEAPTPKKERKKMTGIKVTIIRKDDKKETDG